MGKYIEAPKNIIKEAKNNIYIYKNIIWEKKYGVTKFMELLLLFFFLIKSHTRYNEK